MLKINGVPFDGDYFIEHNDNGIKTLGFDIYTDDNAYQECVVEALVEEKLFYLIKEIDDNGKYLRVLCELDLTAFKQYKLLDRTYTNWSIQQMLNYMKMDYTLKGNFKNDNYSLTVKNAHALDYLLEMQKKFNIFLDFDNKKKILTCTYKDQIEYRGLYITEQLNIISTDNQTDSYELITRLYVYGKDNLSMASANGGKEYIDNFSYTNRIICGIHTDSEVDNATRLKEIAKEILEEKSRPSQSFTFKVFNLSKVDKTDYSLKDIKVNDIVKFIDRKRKKESFHRVVKYKEYPLTPTKDEITLSNNKVSSVVAIANASASSVNINNTGNTNVNTSGISQSQVQEMIRSFREDGLIEYKEDGIYIYSSFPKNGTQGIIKIGIDGNNNFIGFSMKTTAMGMNDFKPAYSGMLSIGGKNYLCVGGIIFDPSTFI